MNKTTFALVIIVVALTSATLGNYMPASGSWWGDPTKGEPSEDVWQDSCMPVLIHDHMTCQQANYIIKQNARMIELLQNMSSH